MSKTTIIDRAETSIIDESGTIIEQHVSEGTRTIVKQEPAYVKLYIQDMFYLHDIPSKLVSLTLALLKHTSYADEDEGLTVYLNAHLKDKIREECGWSKMQTLNNGLSDLCKGEVLKRTGSGTYQFNPWLVGKGDWKNIEKIRVEWDYDRIKGRTFKENSFTYKTEQSGQMVIDFNGGENEQAGSDLAKAL